MPLTLNITPLKLIRLSKKLKQIDITMQTGIPPSRISVLENGYVLPSKKELTLLCEFYQMSSEELFPEINNG